MPIYRGPGGAGDATGDATNASQLALAAAAEAQASATSAASSATNAANSASAAASDAADAATSETNAAGSAADALASENAAASSASDAADSATAAAASASDASDDAASASTSATNAASSASSASTSATNASNSASAAATSATNASNSATTASTAATNAGNSATAAATSATDAAASASTASTQATNAASSATNAASSASAASTSATNAASSASTASTAATNASNSASAASTSASNAATSETNAANSAGAAATSATNAANSATAAAASAAEAATFDPDLYLSKAGNLSGLANTVTAANNIGINPYGNGFKNRIINGAMMIDQRNAGASVTPANNQYLVDRFVYYSSQASKFTAQQNAGSVTPPTGFTNYLGFTSASSYSVGTGDYFSCTHIVEGLNVADLGWGTANAATVTLSFWVRSALTGTFGGSLANSGGSRSYPFTYTISVANTWEQKSITIAGDTSGTWLKTNGAGIALYLGLGVGSTYSGTAGSWAGSLYLSATGATSVVGTSGATFYITGVQLEKGSTATSFDYRPYGTELALCQRYCVVYGGTGTYETIGYGFATSTTVANISVYTPVTMRSLPALTLSSTSPYAVQVSDGISAFAASGFAVNSTTSGVQQIGFGITSSGLTANRAYRVETTGTTGRYVMLSAEL